MTQAIYEKIVALPDELFAAPVKAYNSFYTAKIDLAEFKQKLENAQNSFLKVTEDHKYYNVNVGNFLIAKFVSSYFPTCCAMSLFHNFACAAGTCEEFVHAVLNILAEEDKAVRYVMAIPEYRRDHTCRTDIFNPPAKIDKMNTTYPNIYSWAKSKSHFQEMLFTNHNTARIIHNCEFMVMDEDKFDHYMASYGR